MPDSVVHAFLVAVRAVHFLACIVLFGELLFACAIDPQRTLRPRVVVGCLVAAMLAAIGWLALEALTMSGEPVSAALRPRVVGTVLRSTQFGAVWLLRLALVLALALAAYVAARGDARRTRATALLLAGAYLASLAFAGHAGAGSGRQRVAEVAVDAIHLVAAGAWLGALPALAGALSRERAPLLAAPVVSRFSVIGVLSVLAVAASGVANAWFRVRDPAALLDTDYGQLLLGKLALVAAMVALALVNRFVLTPRLYDDDADAVGALRRSAGWELAAGVLVVALVGALGITPPPAMDAAAAGHPMPHMRQ